MLFMCYCASRGKGLSELTAHPCTNERCGGLNVTLDDIKQFNLQMFQPQHGYRYSLDPLLLARFCCQIPAEGRIIDLGAGCGVISLLLARLNPTVSVAAVENNTGMAALADKNIQHNDLGARVSVYSEDVINLRKSFSVSTFDLVVSNPPFRKAETGKVSPLVGRDSARHETTAGLADFLAAAKYLVKPSGRICFIQHPSRLTEFMALAASIKLSVLRLRMIHSNAESPATMFMAELAKGRRTAPVVEPPLFLREMEEEYIQRRQFEILELFGAVPFDEEYDYKKQRMVE